MLNAIHQLFFDGSVGQITAVTICYISASVIVGRILRRPVFEGAALGFLLILASTDSAYYIARFMHLSLNAFAVIAMFILVGFVLTVRQLRCLPTPEEPTRWWTIAIPIVAIWPIAWMTNIVAPNPMAGYAIFQAWNPLYLNASLNAGRFLLESDVKFGNGILMQQLYYAADIFGPAAWLSFVFGFEANAALYATHIGAVLLTLGVLSAALGNRCLGQIAFVAMTLVFFRWGGAYRTLLGDNWGDNGLFLAGALTIYDLAMSARGLDSLPAAALAAAFMVFGRNYGAFYFAILGLLLFAADFKSNGLSRFRIWCGIAALGTAFAAKELIQVIRYGLYFPRKLLGSEDILSFTAHARGIAVDLGIIPNAHILDLAIPAVLFSLLAAGLVVVFRRRGHGMPLLHLVVPLVVAIPSIFLEVVTGYRTLLVGSKIYHSIIFLSSWYPAFLLSTIDLKVKLSVLRPSLIAASVVGILAMMCAAGFALEQRLESRGGPAAYAEKAFASYRRNITDLQIVRQISARGEEFARNVRQRPIMYFHYEPGIGLRYFLAGDITQDWDFWSDPVQARLKEAESVTDLMQKLGWPNISIGWPSYTSGAFLYPDWKKFKTVFETLASQPWVTDVISYRGSHFYITAPIRPVAK